MWLEVLLLQQQWVLWQRILGVPAAPVLVRLQDQLKLLSPLPVVLLLLLLPQAPWLLLLAPLCCFDWYCLLQVLRTTRMEAQAGEVLQRWSGLQVLSWALMKLLTQDSLLA